MNPYLALIIANVIWGVGVPLYKLVLVDTPPFTLAFLRFAGATIIMFFVYLRYRSVKVRPYLPLLFIIGVLSIGFHMAFFFLGLTKTSSINAPIILSSTPIFLYFLSIFFLKEALRKKVLWGMIIGFAGVLVIILSPILVGNRVAGIDSLEGNILLFIAMLTGVFGPLMQKDKLTHLPAPVITFWLFLFGTLSFVPFVAVELQKWSFSSMSTFDWWVVAFGIVFSSTIAYFLQIYGINRIRVSEVGLFTYIDPIATLIVAGPLLGEYPDISFLVGSLLVFGGIFLAENRLHWHPLQKLKLNAKN